MTGLLTEVEAARQRYHETPTRTLAIALLTTALVSVAAGFVAGWLVRAVEIDEVWGR